MSKTEPVASVIILKAVDDDTSVIVDTIDSETELNAPETDELTEANPVSILLCNEAVALFNDAVASPIALSCDCAVPPVIFISPDICAADAVICPLDFNIKLSSTSEIVVCVTSNPPIEAYINLAKPCELIDANISPEDGVAILLADKSPKIVTSEVITPPVNLNLEPVIPPSAFNIRPPLELDI